MSLMEEYLTLDQEDAVRFCDGLERGGCGANPREHGNWTQTVRSVVVAYPSLWGVGVVLASVTWTHKTWVRFLDVPPFACVV